MPRPRIRVSGGFFVCPPHLSDLGLRLFSGPADAATSPPYPPIASPKREKCPFYADTTHCASRPAPPPVGVEHTRSASSTSKEVTMDWLLYMTTFVVVIALGVWFYRLTH